MENDYENLLIKYEDLRNLERATGNRYVKVLKENRRLRFAFNDLFSKLILLRNNSFNKSVYDPVIEMFNDVCNMYFRKR